MNYSAADGRNAQIKTDNSQVWLTSHRQGKNRQEDSYGAQLKLKKPQICVWPEIEFSENEENLVHRQKSVYMHRGLHAMVFI